MTPKSFYLKFISLLFLFPIISGNVALGQSEGEQFFKQTCAACHTIGQGKLIGPDLAGVHQRRSEDWIIHFVRSSQTMIKNGDPVATALFEEYNRMIMPDNPYSDNQIRAIISYIAENSPGGPGAVQNRQENTASGKPLGDATRENILNGKNLFQGKTRLTQGGASCISCHNVNHTDVIAGGALALDLTNAFTRLNEAGLQAIIANPPFPAMKQAYRNHPLTEAEIYDLAAFLQEVDRGSAIQPSTNYTLRLVFSGLGGAIVLFILFGGVWIRGKRRSVNQDIYNRQIKSV